MRQESRRSSQAAPDLLHALSLHLRTNGAAIPDSGPLAAAIRAWADADSQPGQHGGRHDQSPAPQHARGYRWKTLFLPHATELRVECSCGTFYGEVVGDDIMFQGRSVSPRGMMVAVAGEGRNAWRDLWLKPPGARWWKRANACRLEQEREQERERQRQDAARLHPPSPAEDMAAAAASMADALRTTLSLVGQCSEQARSRLERRGRQHRRQSDMQAEDCAFE